MTRYFLYMAYDGTRFYGWQLQPDQRTVQQVMETTLSTLLREKIRVTGAGRTDTGVHASRYVAHFDVSAPISESSGGDVPGQWVFKLNRFLPPDITVSGIREVTQEMHARFSATSRTYHYHISTLKPLFDRRYTLYHYGKLDTGAISECCEVIRNTQDFTSFSKLHTDVKTHICRIMRADWITLEHGYRFEIQADRFLRNMVRSLVGTLLEVGKGRLSVEDFRNIVEARDRSAAGQSAPARGLFLVDVDYSVL